MTTDADGSGPSSQASYIIVPETAAFHGTPATAQAIPTVAYAGVIGALHPSDTIDLYRVGVGAGALSLRLAVTATTGPSSLSLPVRLLAFDSLGRVILDGTASDGSVNLTVNPRQLGLPIGSALYVGVVSMGTGMMASGYQLWFLRLPGSSDATEQAEGPSLVSVADSSSTPNVPNPSLVNELAPVVAPVASGVGAVPGGPLLVASAQLPTLSAAPSGGVLADGPPTRAVITRSAAEGNAGAIDTGPVGFEPGAGGEGPGATSALVALRGPGGFPLLAAAPVGDWREDTRDAEVGLATDEDEETEDAASSQVRSVAIEVPTTGTLPETLMPVGTADGCAAPGAPAEPGLDVRVAAVATMYGATVDRTTLRDVFDTPPAPDEDRTRRRLKSISDC